MDAIVYAMTVYHGDLIVAGRLTEAGGVRVNRIARWDGRAWSPLGSGVLRPGSFDEPFVAALAVFGDELIAAGSFSVAGGVPASNIARWDGTRWAPLGSGFDTAAQSLAVYGGELIAGGEFVRSGSVPLSHIARWDGTTWQALAEGLDAYPWALAAFGGELIAGGGFTRAGTQAVNHIARWDGVSWSGLGTGTTGGLDGWVTSLAVFQGKLVAGGYFDHAGGIAARAIAAWDGAVWEPLGSGVDAYVFALAAYDGGLAAGGSFTAAGDVAVESIASWDGSAWSDLRTGTGRSHASSEPMMVRSLAAYGGGVAVAGRFDMAREILAVNIACWDPTGWHPLGWGLSDNYYLSWVSCFASYGGWLIVGGRLAHGQGGYLPSVDIRAWDGSAMDLFEWRISGQSTPEVTALAVHRG